MINLENKQVMHNIYGIGTVLLQTDSHITVSFGMQDAPKKFTFPDAFKMYLQCLDPEIQSVIIKLIENKEKELLERKKKQEEERTRFTQVIDVPKPREVKKNKVKKANIAFKCNYCDGGEKDNGIGYCGACSDNLIKFNVMEARHAWCSDYSSPCMQYLSCKINRKDLNSYIENDGFVCYESQILRNWTAYAGNVLKGENRDKPKKINKVKENSLAILTTREPGKLEEDRIIFGVFLVDETYEGDYYNEGYVSTQSKYKISLSINEARKIKFWNFYANGNSPEKISWGQGLYRYLSDIQAASILNDIYEIKKGTKDEVLSKEFLNEFCRINNISIQELPVYEGALRVKK